MTIAYCCLLCGKERGRHTNGRVLPCDCRQKSMIPVGSRVHEQTEAITMQAHAGDCRYCGNPVKMHRSFETMELQPDNCRCLFCGQSYYVVIVGSIGAWEEEQWQQKAGRSSV